MNARTPRGFRDILPAEAALREVITSSIQDLFKLWGYEPVETPTLETLSALDGHGFASAATFKLFDSDGELLVMRPDITLPIARLVGTRIGAPTNGQALRLRYKQTVFREERVFETQARALTQIGVECIGLASMAADTEILLLVAEALELAGITDCTIALCTVSILQAILDACVSNGQLTPDWRPAVLAAWHKSDLVAVDKLMDDPGVDTVYGQVIRSLARLQGGIEAIERCAQLISRLKTNGSTDAQAIQRCAAGLERLQQTFLLITELRPDTDWLIDFSLMSSFDYYTGLVFAAFAPGTGYPLASGGRYDQTLAQFGTPAPAIGFALVLERLIATLMASETTGKLSSTSSSAQRISARSAELAEAFLQAKRMRAEGIAVIVEEGEA